MTIRLVIRVPVPRVGFAGPAMRPVDLIDARDLDHGLAIARTKYRQYARSLTVDTMVKRVISTCKECKGSGADQRHNDRDCRACKGTGRPKQ